MCLSDVHLRFQRFPLAPLHFAAQTGNPSISALLVERGASLAATDRNGQAPLHDAIAANSVFLTQLLVAFKVDPNALDNQRLEPLHFAVDLGHRCHSVNSRSESDPLSGEEACWTPIRLVASCSLTASAI
jgi:ankyrin repeat protein